MKKLLSYLRPRWRKVSADLWESKTRTILVVASIAVGVFAVGTIVSAFAIMGEEIDESYFSVNPANIGIRTRPFTDDLIHSIQKEPGVVDVDGEYLNSFRMSRDSETWETFTLVGREDFADQTINQVELLEGEWAQSEDELMFGYEKMRDPGFRVGDKAFVELANGNVREMKVVGLIQDQSTAGDFTALNRAYVPLDTLNWLGEPEQSNHLLVTVDSQIRGDQDAIEEIATAVEDKMQRGGLPVYQTTTTETEAHPMVSIILALLGVLGALGVLIMLLSSSLIVNTLNALLAQHLRQIGVMKLVGGRSAQISIMYILLILAYGLIALVISVPFGALAGYRLSLFIADFMGANISGFRIIPQAIIIQIAIAFIVPIAAGFYPVNRGSKIKIRRAISDNGPGDQGTSAAFLDSMGRWLKWVSRPLLLSIRNTFRRKGRLLLTLFTLTMAGAIFIAVFNVRDSMESFMDMLGQHFMADITLTFSQPYREAKVRQDVSQVAGVDHVEGWLVGIGDIMDEEDNAEETVSILAPPVETKLLEPDIVAGRWLQPGDHKGVVFADNIWETYPDLQPGDTIRISIQGGRTEEWQVLGMFRFIGMVGINFAYTDYDTMAEFTGAPGQTASYRVVGTDQTLAGQQALGAELDEYLRFRGYNIDTIEAGLVTREENGQAINILIAFLLTMAILTAVVGSIGLAGTMGMNVLERTREIGVMRAIGAVDLEIIKSVVVEGVMIGLISWVIAVVLSFPISYLLLNIIGNAMINAGVPLSITLQGFVVWLLVVLTLSVIASILPARNAARLTIREVLAYE